MQELLEDFLRFENESKVLEFHYQYRNMLVWPFIRSTVFDAIVKSKKGEEAGFANFLEQNKGRSKIFSFKWWHIIKLNKNPLLIRTKKDILFLYLAIENVKDDTGKYYGRIHDFFVELHDRTGIIESDPLFRHFYPKKNRAYESDSLDIVCLFNERIAKLNKADNLMIVRFLDYLKREMPFEIKDTYWCTIKAVLKKFAKNNKLVYQYYKRCFLNMEPKIVFVADGCYGEYAACKIKVLRDLGIPCAEIQHGLVSLAHCAYNYSDLVHRSREYQEYMPDYYLTFGKFWMKCVRIPIAMEVLGSANFYRNYRKMKGDQAGAILILPVETEPYLDLVSFLAQNLQDREIIVKIHPLLRGQYEAFCRQKQENVRVYIDGNIYEYLDMSNVVIGDSSTVLYEAAALEKIVMVWNNEYSVHIDKRIGHWFEDKYGLLSLLKNTELEDKKNIDGNEIFDMNIKENYLNFIGRYL